MGLLIRGSEKIYLITRIGLFWSSLSKRKPSRNIHVSIRRKVNIVCVGINILKEKIRHFKMQSNRVFFLMVFANMTNYVLDAKSGWISNLTSFLPPSFSPHLCHHHPTPHITLSSGIFTWRMWAWFNSKITCWLTYYRWITELGMKLWNGRKMGPLGKQKCQTQGANRLVVTQAWTHRAITQGRVCYNKTADIVLLASLHGSGGNSYLFLQKRELWTGP